VSSNNPSKYDRNRNLWRKIYPIGSPRRAPETVNLVDAETDLSYSLDLQQVVRHRDYFKIISVATSFSGSGGGILLGEYDEGLIHFSNETSKVFSYSFTFSNSPIVVFTVEDESPDQGGVTENINIFGTTSSATGATVGLSAPYSGTVRYRAAYAPSYPYYFQSAFAPISGTFRASAGSLVIPSQAFFTASWTALVATPAKVLQSTWDTLSNLEANVAITLDAASVDADSAISELSAPASASVHFIAYETE